MLHKYDFYSLYYWDALKQKWIEYSRFSEYYGEQRIQRNHLKLFQHKCTAIAGRNYTSYANNKTPR